MPQGLEVLKFHRFRYLIVTLQDPDSIRFLDRNIRPGGAGAAGVLQGLPRLPLVIPEQAISFSRILHVLWQRSTRTYGHVFSGTGLGPQPFPANDKMPVWLPAVIKFKGLAVQRNRQRDDRNTGRQRVALAVLFAHRASGSVFGSGVHCQPGRCGSPRTIAAFVATTLPPTSHKSFCRADRCSLCTRIRLPCKCLATSSGLAPSRARSATVKPKGGRKVESTA
jgi:hypothetical protein